jgi:hypothetical protein
MTAVRAGVIPAGAGPMHGHRGAQGESSETAVEWTSADSFLDDHPGPDRIHHAGSRLGPPGSPRNAGDSSTTGASDTGGQMQWPAQLGHPGVLS